MWIGPLAIKTPSPVDLRRGTIAAGPNPVANSGMAPAACPQQSDRRATALRRHVAVSGTASPNWPASAPADCNF